MCEVYLETVKWNTYQLEQSAMQLIAYYTRSLGFLDTENWIMNALGHLKPNLEGQSNQQLVLRASGFNLIFFGSNQLPERVTTNGQVMYRQRNPRFVFQDETFGLLPPSWRSIIYRRNRAISEEMRNTYKLRIGQDPLTFYFPKEVYAHDIRFHKARLLGSNG